MSSFATYLLGVLVLIVGLGIAAYLLNVPLLWIVAGVIVVLGLGLGIARATRRTKPPAPPAGPLS